MDSRYVYKKYLEKQNYVKNLWLANFVQVLALLTFATFIMEIVIFYVILSQKMLLHPVGVYWVKFILLPISLELALVGVSYLVYNFAKTTIYLKQMILSICFVVYGFVAVCMHTGYVAILAVGVIPILVGVVHERYSILVVNYFLTTGLYAFGAFNKVLDPWKNIDGAYLINVAVVVFLYFVAFLLGIFIIRYYRQLSKNDLMDSVDRFEIVERVHVAGIDSVVSYVDLMAALTNFDFANEDYSLALVDIHDLTHLNRRYSFEYGDKLLIGIGNILKNQNIKGSFYRYGGDKFCVVYANDNPKPVDEYLEDVIKECQVFDDNISLAVGFKQYDLELTLEQNLNEAYIQLQKAKKSN